jgi:hypothetical protein
LSGRGTIYKLGLIFYRLNEGPKMTTRFFGVFLALFCLMSSPASAGWRMYKVNSGKVVDYQGCGRQEHVIRQMKKHPELYGKPPASLAAAQTTGKHPKFWNRPQASMASLKSQ